MQVGVRVERVERLDDPRLADYRDLGDAARRVRDGVFVAESRFVVRRLLAASPFHARSVLATAPALAGLDDVLAARPVPPRVYVAERALIERVTGFDFHRGCLAVGERGVPREPAALLAAARLLVVLERVADPDNVGAVFRNAAAFGADAVLLSPGTADPLYRKAVRVSLGATLTTPFATLADWPADLAQLRAAGFALVALAPDPGAEDLGTFAADPLPPRLALLVGTEGDGLGAAVRAAADVAVRIPMAPGVEALNVATATGIALHRLARA